MHATCAAVASRPFTAHRMPSFRLGRGARAGSTIVWVSRSCASRPALRIEGLVEVCVTVDRVYGYFSSTTHLHRRERGGGEDTAMCGSATTEPGPRCLT